MTINRRRFLGTVALGALATACSAEQTGSPSPTPTTTTTTPQAPVDDSPGAGATGLERTPRTAARRVDTSR
jgi:hypothetical protein